MAPIVRDWRNDLIEAYPDLFYPMPDNPLFDSHILEP